MLSTFMAPHRLYILTKNRPKNNFTNLAITFDHDLQMTRNWYGSKVLVETHIFRGVSSQSGHFPKIGFSNQNDQTETPNLYIFSGGSLTILYISNTPWKMYRLMQKWGSTPPPLYITKGVVILQTCHLYCQGHKSAH